MAIPYEHVLSVSLVLVMVLLNVKMNRAVAVNQPVLFAQEPLPLPSSNKSESLRPLIHFSAEHGFINDPNGVFYDAASETWHLYYQYNPAGTTAANQHWGHATSKSLYQWQEEEIALYPIDDEGIFSGSIVFDPENTSGLFPDRSDGILAYYTTNRADQQTQDLAFSHDGGYTFAKYSNNPLISVASRHFRDPKVFWYNDRWVMVVAYSDQYSLGIYTSPDALSWSHASNFSGYGLLGSLWECPNLIEMPIFGSAGTKWLLYLSINPGAPMGGSIGQYFTGDFNGTHFTPCDSVTRIADWGKDNYAAQFFYGLSPHDPQVSIAWASNWQYANDVATSADGWAGVMSLPRTNYLRYDTWTGYTLTSLPYGLAEWRKKDAVARTQTLSNPWQVDLSNTSGTFALDVSVTNIDLSLVDDNASVEFVISSSKSGEKISGGMLITEFSSQWIDRGGIRGWDHIHNTDRFSVALRIHDALDFQIVVDRSILEIFLMEGEKSATLIYYPMDILDHITLTMQGLGSGVRVDARVYDLPAIIR